MQKNSHVEHGNWDNTILFAEVQGNYISTVS
jgi:hypothetical protein